MKLTSHILPILAALAALAACGSRTSAPKSVEAWLEQSPDGPAGQLCVVDSLMWQQPDSALTLLLDFAAGPQADSLDVFNGHYFQLLVSELLYKNYYSQNNREELLRAVDYFDSLTANSHGMPTQLRNVFLDARAHYINGVGYYERDSVVEACAEYMRALEVMDGHFEESGIVGKKAQFMALNYTHLSEVFSDQYLHEQAIHFGKESLVYYGKYDATAWHKAWILNEIGSHYDMMDNFDSAVYYYNKSRVVLSDTTSLMYRDVSAHQAFLSYRRGGDFQVSINQLRGLIAQAEHPNEPPSRSAFIGEIYYQEKEYDSAMYYMKVVFKESPYIESRKLAAERLVELCEALGREDEIMEYAAFLVPFATQNEDNGMMKSQLAELYRSLLRKQLERKHQQASERNMKRTVVLLFSFLAIISATVALYLKNRKNGERLKAQIKEEQSSHEIQRKALSGKLKKSKDELRELREQIGKQDDKGRPFSFAPSFKEEPVCRLIMERVNEGRFMSQMDCTVYKEYALSKEHLTELRKAADHHFNQFTVRISKAHPELTRLDLDYCCLYLLDLTDADISALMQRAYNTVNERNSKLRRIFGVDTSVAAALQAIANEF